MIYDGIRWYTMVYDGIYHMLTVYTSHRYQKDDTKLLKTIL